MKIENVVIGRVASVSEYAPEPVKSELDQWFKVRELAQEACDHTPGYCNLSLKGKNAIYDIFREKAIKEVFGNGCGKEDHPAGRRRRAGG